MRGRRGGQILMAFGVVLALLAGGIVFVISQTATQPAAAEVVKKDVVVVLTEIPERTIIADAQVKVEQWPENLIPPGAVAKAEDVVGKFAKTKLTPRLPVLGTQVAGIVTPSGKETSAGASPKPDAKTAPQVSAAYVLEKGKVLVAVNYPGAAALVGSGAVKPGDHVDIIVRSEGANGIQIAPIFRNIEIKAMGSIGAGEAGVAGSTQFVFEVVPQDGLILKFLETLNADILLRAAGDAVNPQTDLVTIDYIINRYGLQRPPTKQ